MVDFDPGDWSPEQKSSLETTFFLFPFPIWSHIWSPGKIFDSGDHILFANLISGLQSTKSALNLFWMDSRKMFCCTAEGKLLSSVDHVENWDLSATKNCPKEQIFITKYLEFYVLVQQNWVTLNRIMNFSMICVPGTNPVCSNYFITDLGVETFQLLDFISYLKRTNKSKSI